MFAAENTCCEVVTKTRYTWSHPSYSLDLAPCGYFLLAKLKQWCDGLIEKNSRQIVN